MSTCNYVTTINGTDCIGDTRGIINQNFLNLDSAVCALSTTSVNAGSTPTINLTYNPVNRSITGTVNPQSITVTELANNAVETGIIKDLAVTTNKIAFDGGSFSFRNKVINGNFNIWQRGTSFSNTNGFTADRFVVTRGGSIINTSSTTNLTVTKDSTVPTSPSTFLNSIKIQRTPGDLIGNSIFLLYAFETEDILEYIGKNVTFSFFILTGTTFTSTDLTPYLYTGTSINQGITQMHSNSWSGQTTQTGSVIPAFPGTWQKISNTFVVPANARELGIGIGFTPQAGAASSDESIYVTGVQLETGNTATPFEHRLLGTELALCQRYYEKSYSLNTVPGTPGAPGALSVEETIPTGKIQNTQISFKTSKRTIPQINIYNSSNGNLGEVFNTATSIGVGVNNVMAGENNATSIQLLTPLPGTVNLEWHYTADAELY